MAHKRKPGVERWSVHYGVFTLEFMTRFMMEFVSVHEAFSSGILTIAEWLQQVAHPRNWH